MSLSIAPADEYNQALVEHTHPPEWENPKPAGKYNLIAIGGGSAGIISALGAAGLGGRAALIERHLLGGDCLNYGCVPSKALIRAARAAYQIRHGDRFGCPVENVPEVDFAAVMERMRRLRSRISQHDAAQRFKAMGVDVYLGDARFTSPSSLEVAGTQLEFRRAVIATGGRAAEPPIKGLKETGYLTNETVFSLTELPHRLVVIGGGSIGCEMAQTFRRLGSTVHLVDVAPRLLPRDEAAAANVVQGQFEQEGIHLYLGFEVQATEKTGHSKSVIIERKGERQKLIADEILVAVGRRPNLEGLDLEAANVKYHKRGVEINDRLQTSNPRIFAAGDICASYQFTHAADAMARLCIQNALFFGRKKLSQLVMPWCTYTDPEVAHVGLTPEAAEARGIAIDSYHVELKEVDRAVLDGEDQGFAVVHTRKGSGKIAGATIVSAHAGESISEITLLMTKKLSLGSLADVIHCYPTQAEVLKRIADNYNRKRLTPNIAQLFKKWLEWQR